MRRNALYNPNSMNKLKTDYSGGFPVKLDDLRWVDNSIRTSLKGILSAFGVADSTAIKLSGCNRTVSVGIVTISEGYVSIGGEVCYVPEHTYSNPSLGQSEYWGIDITYDGAGTKTFQNESVNDTYEVRIGKISVGIPPLGTTTYQNTKTIYEIINSNIDTTPLGVIVMWSGAPENKPAGYELCDGENGTPDLRGRFVIGYDARITNPANGIWDSNYNTIGATGGEKEHQLTAAELPPHYHNVLMNNAADISEDLTGLIIPSATVGFVDYDPIDISVSTSNSGSNQKHENRPPYYVLCYIMKTESFINADPPTTAPPPAG